MAAPFGIAIDAGMRVWVTNSRGNTNGNVQLITSAALDPAGNIWAANNWNVAEAVVDPDPDRKVFTKAGGDGVVVFYGMAAPVVTPLMGPVRAP